MGETTPERDPERRERERRVEQAAPQVGDRWKLRNPIRDRRTGGARTEATSQSTDKSGRHEP